MSQNIDEILRELSDLSFEPSEEPSGEKLPDGDWPHGGHTPSVTETLMAVRELIGEPASMEEKAEALDDVVESLEEPAPEKLSLTKSVQQEIPAEETPLSTSQETPKAPSGKQKVKKSRIRLSGSPSRSPSRSPSQNPSQSPSQSLPQSRPCFTPVVRISREELIQDSEEPGAAESLPLSRREKPGGDTVRFTSSTPSPHEGRLSGGAALKSMTRKASSADSEEEGKTQRLETPSEAVTDSTRVIPSDEPAAQTPEPPSEEEIQSLLEKVEKTEEEPVPELSREELRRLKKEQQEGHERLRREKQKEREKRAGEQQADESASGGKNLYRVREGLSGESQSGFAPAFKRLSHLNASDQISAWKKALRDMAGTSIGLGLLLGFLAAVSLVLIVLSDLLGMKGERAFLFAETAVGLAGGVIGFSTVWGGLKSFFRFREDRDILPSFVYLASMLPTIGAAAGSFFPETGLASMPVFLPVGLFGLSFAFFSRWTAASTALRNLRFLHSGGSKYYLHVIRDGRLAAEMTRGVVDGPAFVAVNRQTESIADFMKLSFSSDDSDRFSRNLSLLGLPAGLLAFGFVLLLGWNTADAWTLATAVFCLFSPLMTVFIFSYPSRRISRFMERAGGAVIGEKAIGRYSLLNGVVVDAGDIFPAGFVTLSGLKTYGSARVDDVILDAASMIRDSGSILSGIFEGIVGRDSGLLRNVEERKYEDGLGLSGFIGDRQVLLGSRALLESRGIRLSLDEHRSWNAGTGCASVYLASGGELAGVFLIRLQSSVRSEEAVQIFADNGVRLSVRTSDSFLTPRLIGRLFQINPELVKILPDRLGLYVDRLRGRVRVKQPVAVNDGSLSGFAGCAACSRRLAFMEGLNRVLCILAVVMGLSMLLVLSVLGAFTSVTPLYMTVYALFWPVLGLILQKMIRI